MANARVEEALEDLVKTLFQGMEDLPSSEQAEAIIKGMEHGLKSLDAIAGALTILADYVQTYGPGRSP